MPTCGAMSMVFEIETWRKINKGRGILSFFDFPNTHE